MLPIQYKPWVADTQAIETEWGAVLKSDTHDIFFVCVRDQSAVWRKTLAYARSSTPTSAIYGTAGRRSHALNAGD